MDIDTRAPEKKKCLLAALEKGKVMIHLDARRSGVAVPEHLGHEMHLRLNLSYNFDPPDLSVGEWGVKSTLSFSGSRFCVAVPWSALFAITSHVTRQHWEYVESIPPELLAAVPATEAAKSPPPALQPAPVPVPEAPRVVLREVPMEPLREVPMDPPPPTDTVEPAPEEPPKPRGRAHLRVVK